MTETSALSSALASDCRERVLALLGAHDAILVATSAAAVTYCSGYRSMGYDTDPGHRMAAVFDREDWILVGPAADLWAAAECSGEHLRYHGYHPFFFAEPSEAAGICEFRAFNSFDDAVAAAIRALAAGKTRLVVEDGGSFGDVTGFNVLARAEAQALFRSARSTKSPAEIALLRAATRATEIALAQALAEARAGVSELDLAAGISARMIRAGLRPGFVVVTSGPRSALVDAYASARRLKGGDLVRFDIGGTYNGYWSDTAASAAVGEPPADARSVNMAIVEGQQAALRLVKPGISSDVLFRETVAAVRAAGLPAYRRHHVGHGLGLEPHEFPTLGARDPVCLEPGMVINVETPYYRPGWGGLMYEDTLLVTDTGAERLTALEAELLNLPA